MENEFLTVAEAAARIAEGRIMVLAGDEALLSQLPKGRWIGGTTVYFITETGGEERRDKLFCTTFPMGTDARPRLVATKDLPQISEGYTTHGFSLILVPAFSTTHSEFALHGASFPGLFEQPLFGWVTGVGLDEIGKRKPKVFIGSDGSSHEDGAALLHVELPGELSADLDILNIFERGGEANPPILFETSGFTVTEALVAGQRVNLAEYVTRTGMDTKLPLVANYAGALINVSIQEVDLAKGQVTLYAPVLAGVEYRQAEALGNYAEAFSDKVGTSGAGQFSCNCILNYLYGDMTGKRTGAFTGPVTFGEIAYVLLNQTLVRMDIQAA
ncbi:DUF6976 family protein [Stagnihabitans tardus]|uniref:Uncharacterized protein n=1 Tax=Stagnihabitans tardus TaxID=2699202 RepID=A0AAE4Y854_9RHOB|nr:hypothetical protein [Stagnihabitans tardus]NBZ86333.1 hypothetical protein [Stagnihabitans tardus]